MRKFFIKYLIMLIPVVGIWSCADDDDHLGDTSIQASSPTITITLPTNSATFIEKDTTFDISVSMSTPQLIDVYVYINKVGGNASSGSDFTVDNRIIIPATKTSAKAQIKLLADEDPEDTETLTLTIGDSRTVNASITPQTIEFTILNVSEDDLPLEMSWGLTYFDAGGNAVSPTDAADMIMYLTDMDGNVLATADGASFESLVMEGTDPDGVYLVKAGIYSVIDGGDLGPPPVLDLTLAYSQLGKISESEITFPSAFNTALVCDGNLYTIATITKTGSSYEVERVGEATSVDISGFLATYDCDEPGYAVYDVTFTAGPTPGSIINDNFWDAGFVIRYVLDVCGTVTIPSQTTSGYVITGSGTYDVDTKEMVVDYTVKSATSGATVDANTHTFTLK